MLMEAYSTSCMRRRAERDARRELSGVRRVERSGIAGREAKGELEWEDHTSRAAAWLWRTASVGTQIPARVAQLVKPSRETRMALGILT